MSQWRSIPQENATPRAAQPSPTSELPPAIFISARPGNLRATACNAAPCLPVGLAALSAIAAITVLVFFCWSVYKGRGALSLRSRRLANSEDNGPSLGICGTPGDTDGQQRPQGLSTERKSSGDEWRLPLKKRKLARAAETGSGGDGRKPQQQEQQQRFRAPEAGPSGLPERQANLRQEQVASAAYPAQSHLSTMQAPKQADAKAAAELGKLHPHQHDGGYFSAGTSHTTFSSTLFMQLQGQQETGPSLWHFPLQGHLQQRGQQQTLMKHQQGDLLQQPEQQESLLQQQQKQHAMQHEAQQKRVQQQEDKLILQGEQQATPEWRREQQQPQERSTGRGELDPQAETQLTLLEPAAASADHFPEDPWIVLESTVPGVPQFGAAEKALQFSFATSTGPSTIGSSSTFSAREYPLDFIAASAERASKDIGVAAPLLEATGTSAPAVLEGHTAGQSSAALATAGGGTNAEWLAPFGMRTGISIQHAGAAANGTRYAVTAAAATPANRGQPGTLETAIAAVGEHPYARLPKPLGDPTKTILHFIDMGRAVTNPVGRRDLLPLLQKAHDLLLRPFLCVSDMDALAHVTGELIEHAIQRQFPDLSKQTTLRALEQLGLRFLLMDAVVSALIVIRQPVLMDHWKLFADAISHHPPCMRRQQDQRGRRAFSATLAYELSRAIQTLKMGQRPNALQLVKIKRMLFCSPFSPARFKRVGYDRWRRDDHGSTG
ncbi:hypothetical protein EBH_0039720 [Eimeria brunetti]|uniref:Uncharacterized protein n=1 Tax=Eimeria brunetti TaxID=51314 RepID=U6LPE9_9EIME|nr:hypothetical protein EBH_0039720 [Eimeria brunetti]